MDKELESRWREAERQKNTTPGHLKALVARMEREMGADRLPLNWSQRVETSIQKERGEVEKRYNIRIGETEIYCVRCGKPCLPGNHSCSGKQAIRKNRLPKVENPNPNRQWFWCPSREQRVCEEICQNSLLMEKCIHTPKGCKLKPKPMSEETKMRLRGYSEKAKEKPEEGGLRLLDKVRTIGRSKTATLLKIKRGTVSRWIDRGKIPNKYQDMVATI